MPTALQSEPTITIMERIVCSTTEGRYLMKGMSAVALSLLLPAAVAQAHSLARYASTPITPPKEFTWWFPFAIGILLAGAFLTIWCSMGRRWYFAIGLSVCAVVLFAIPFFLFGRMAAGASTAPPPGLDVPHRTMWGMGWRRAGCTFVYWNLLGYVFFSCSLFVCSGVYRAKRRLKKLAACALATYVIALVPYVSRGALVHGWAGGYVHRGCEERIELLCGALIEYSKKHDGRFPSADSIESLLPQLQPYLPKDRIHDLLPIDICPLGGAFERHPKPYEWDTTFSGIHVRSLDSAMFRENRSPFVCPYHRRAGTWGTFVLKKYVWEKPFDEDTGEPDARDDP
ncbi:MAG: hypothetical protein JXA69_17245 [Phycisphaerae bacterium]|nr:hypothetical protein [Phycisphaerae bacterium]